MVTLKITRGFSGSGKSTWADKEILASKGKVVGVNRDLLRMMTGRKWWPADEHLVSDVAMATIKAAIARGKDVIVDDTFLKESFVDAMAGLAKSLGAEFQVQSFLHVPLHECIKRDAARDRSVGKDVIEQQYATYWSQQPKPANEGKPAILVDVDGTLAHTNIPYPAAYTRDYKDDSSDEGVITLVNAALLQQLQIIIMSGRKEEAREDTEFWLRKHAVPNHMLVMRRSGDDRDDATVKKELYMEHVQGKYKIMYALDDRPRVVRMWRHEVGLKVLHVTDNWEF